MAADDSAPLLRLARAGEGVHLFEVTRLSVASLARGHYSDAQIAGWMGARTPSYYEGLIARGGVVVAALGDTVLGFVDAEPGEITRLFLRPEAAGSGLGRRLLEIGLAAARHGHDGPVTVESTLNAEGFHARHGFRRIGRGTFSHGIGGDPIEIVQMELPRAPTGPSAETGSPRT
ncbi:GNAT family N-acetyltransferase [Ancylobacter sp. IITR112]|uniref:GNAT family N-acetyltransferase n=1 Tax=Ancylobacter sp. IITR112 TaxID=3138073 RepID=UPI003529F2C4